jgi:hypothetical protein
MRINRNELKTSLTHFAGNSHVHPHEYQQVRDTALTALEYIRQLEADLRRQGFTEYNTKEEDNDQQ